MSVVERWIVEHFDLLEVDSVRHVYSENGPTSWQSPSRGVAGELDPSHLADWWPMVCLGEFLRSIEPDMRVLDIGCGPGWPAIPLSQRVRHLTAVDASELAVAKTREAVKQRDIRNMEVCVSDASSLPFADHSFDAVVANDLMDVVPDPLAVAKESLRVLRPGGVVVSLVQNFRNILRTSLAQVAGKAVDAARPYWQCQRRTGAGTREYHYHVASLAPPHTAEFRFRLRSGSPTPGSQSVSLEMAYAGEEDVLKELVELEPFLERQAEVYRTLEFTPEDAAWPFASAGFTDVTVTPLCAEMCHAFAATLSERPNLYDRRDDLNALVGSLLAAMRFADPEQSHELSVKGKLP